MSAPGLPPPVVIGRIAGPLVVSLFLNAAAFGMLCVQVYLYYLAFPSDRFRSKAIVCIVFIIELIQTVMTIRALFKAFVYGFLDLSSLDHIGNLWISVPILGGVVAFISQTFYTYRIVTLGSLGPSQAVKYVAALVVLFALVQLGGSIAIGLEMLSAKQFSRFTVNPRVKITVVFWNGGGALCDIIIAVSMTYLLVQSSKGTMRDTRAVVQRLIRLTIETGSVTAVIAIINLILALLPGDPTYYQTTATVLSKMYANTLLVLFNNRMRLYSEGHSKPRPKNTMPTFQLSGTEFTSNKSNSRGPPDTTEEYPWND